MNLLLIRLEQILDQLQREDPFINRQVIAEGRQIVSQLRDTVAMLEALTDPNQRHT